MPKTHRILLAFQLPEALRDVLQGISGYVTHAGRRWQVECVDDHDFHTAIDNGIVDGAITGLGPRSRKLVNRLLHARIPIVNVLRDLHPKLPSVLSDNHAIGRAGAEYFRQQGFRQFGFVGVDTPWSREREAGFRAVLHAAALPPPLGVEHLGIVDFEYASKVRAKQMLCRWVRKLPRGIAVMCAADFISRTLLAACERESVTVPEDLVILGVDNFQGVCESAPVPLSSIAQDFEGMGREAAALLDRLMQGKAVQQKRPLLLPPARLSVRKSTDRLAFQDPIVVAALRIIHEHAGVGLSMKELLAQTPLSRKWLDHRFKQIVGHTPSAEIRRCRLLSVRDTLVDTEMPLRQIAARGRFSCVQNLVRSFRSAYGMSPQAYRVQFRIAHPVLKTPRRVVTRA